MEAKTSMSDWQGCLWPAIFSKVTLHIFSVFILIAVSNASSSSLHLKHGALRNRYVSLEIERQFFKMKNAWCGSINSRFSVMLSSTLVFAFKCSGADSWCRGDPSNCQWMGSGIEKDGNWSHPSLEFQSSEWMQDLAFMVDITQHLNNHNKMLQGGKRLVTQYYGTIYTFKLKLSLWETQLSGDDYGNQKSINSKFFCCFESSCNAHKPNFTLIPWGNPKLLGQKNVKVKIYRYVKIFL